ncbi:hypothetical protein HVW49_00130 [Escherichia fergusonii]|uniref:hypothetical protein n=1 Tax=Escherichia fergusonii TaxID=564 RepID=UPI0015EA7526|nr:hypothetical protein [Escherichia fergusonii]QMA54756.1 hypothetical protein HV025_00130 [Escherichia fergusonii]QMA77277.1 hypothetical protein HV020_00130 [Escherichia fergusonii]QMA90696.1 hypothetical protein HV015_00130 [Escherichia fergusonii]QMO20556.1 hypothetical protein HVW49_00130 [Escherichia fergusonii]QMO58328.1 hypothetical protein HVW38_00130 [Escherichia fergusonii]
MNKVILHNLWWVTFILSTLLLSVHTFKFMEINVDSTSILLLIIILTCPFIASVRKIKYGDFEAEIDPKEIQKIKTEAEKNAGLKESDDEIRPEIYTTTESIRDLASSDPVIALAKVRIELEKVLNKLARIAGIEIKRPVLGMLVKTLSNHEIISSGIGKSLTEVIGICNRAMHGEVISEDSANTIVSLGIELIEDLYWSVQEQISSGSIVSEENISRNELDYYYHMKKYRLTSIIPLVETPKKVVRELTQEQLDEFLENYNEYAEFIVELIEMPKNG